MASTVETPGRPPGKVLQLSCQTGGSGRPVIRTLGSSACATPPRADAGTSRGDIKIMQAAYTAESLAVFLYSAIIKDFASFHHPRLKNKDYFEAALKNEKDHKALLAHARGSHRPTGLRFKIPASAVSSGQALLNTAWLWRRRSSRPTSGRSRSSAPWI